MKCEILVKVFERSIEFQSTNDNTLKWISLEIERNHFFLGNPRVFSVRGRTLQVNGFSDHSHARKCAEWVEGLLFNDRWEEEAKKDRPRNERWYKKSFTEKRKS